MKRSHKKSFDWYGISQRFSIRKYHFGAASVLLGAALVLGNSTTVSADGTTVATPQTESVTELVTEQPQADVEAQPVNTSSDATSVVTDASTPVESVPPIDNTAESTSPSSPEEPSETVSEGEAVKEETSQVETAEKTVSLDTSLVTTPQERQAVAAETLKQDDSYFASLLEDSKVEALAGGDRSPLDTNTPQVSGSGVLNDPTAVPDISMDNANGATVTAVPDRLQALIAAGYAVDPDPNRLTYGIYSPTKLNERAGTNYYVTFSFTEDPNRKDLNVYLNLVDKNTNNVVESVTVSDWTAQVVPNYTFKTLDALKNAGTVHSNYTFTPSISESGGFTQRTIAVFSVGDSHETGTMLYDLAHIFNEGISENGSQVIDSQYSYQSTFYIAKNPDGSYTKLATWVNEGWSGQAYTISGKRQFEGYELISSPTDAQKSGTLAAKPPVGFKWIDSTVLTLKDGSKQYREGEVVDTAGSVVYRIYQHNQVAYTSQPLASGEYATDAGPLRVTPTAPIGSGFKGDEGHVFKIQNNSKYASTDVAYYYVPQGTVTVHYVDTEGNVIADAVVDTEKTVSGTEYSTTDHKPTSITTTDGKVYYLKPQDEVATSNLVGEKSIVNITDANKAYTSVVGETGTVEASTNKHVIYIYEQAGSVLVHYVNEAGDTIKKDVVDTDNQPANSSYDTAVDNKPNRISTDDGILYELVPEKTSGAQEQGIVVAGQTLEVTYVYKEVKGDVQIKYVDTKGNTLKDTYTDTTDGRIGSAYNTADNADEKPETIDKAGVTYRLVPSLTQGAEQGKVVEGMTTITYVYEPVLGDVVVHYVDTEGNILQAPYTDMDEANLDEPYDTSTDEIEKPKTITVNGVTYKLKEIASSGTVGGQTIVEETANNIVTTAEVGKVTEGTTNVIYVYEKVTVGDVIVHYVDEAGNPLQGDAVDTKGADVDTPYDTTDNNMKPTTIVANGKTYELVPEKTQGNETGKVVEGITEVVYVYREVVEGIPEDYPTYELPEVDIPETPKDPGQDVPNIPVTPEKPGDNIPVTPVIPEKTGHDIPVEPQVPGNDIPTSSVVIENTPIETTPDLESDQEVDQLPNTGDSDGVAASIVGVGSLLAALGLAGKRRKKEDED